MISSSIGLAFRGMKEHLGGVSEPERAQQIVHFEFIEKMPPLSVGVAEQLGNGLIFNSQIHASLQLVVRSERESSLPNRFYPFSPGEGIRL